MDDEKSVTLLTCSGISHTGKLTTQAAHALRQRNPSLIARHLKLTALHHALEKEMEGEDYLVVVDGCEECCAKKRTEGIGIDPDIYIVATREGIVKRGLEEVRYDEIETLSQAISQKIKK
ncbi:MAG TPA: putative zinc-binding protein [Methanoregulaceae archaeon]|nr:putative zinc-binding protein [Methanoregulaceae archaeon]